MSAWYEQPYELGPPVSAPGFPRPLYPPDAKEKGKTPSVNGPDVEAYKRTVARAGRWPWQKFDQAFSNGFAHGSSGNVGETGIAGVQRQQGIEDTGWVGKKTFDLLCSIRVPDGAHKGEMAMDAYAQSLVVQAWEQFGGQEPPPEPARTLRELALSKAITQIGVKESPAYSNKVPYTDWYGLTGPWCAMFVTWCFETSGDSPSFKQGRSYAYVPYMVNDARAYRNGLAVTKDPIPGDVVMFDWEGDGVHDHVGLFEKMLPNGNMQTIEGNTAVGNESNGGQVMRRERARARTVIARVREP
jgi:hypothetical protein